MWRWLAIAALCGGSACGGGPSEPAAPVDSALPLDAPARTGAGPGGGTIDELRFAVVGDTRPVNLDDTAHYPTAIVQQIWMDVEAESPHPAFAISTGDYMFASVNGSEQGPQLDAYLGARASFDGVVYPALGNHECNGFTDSNCGPAGADLEPPNYQLFLSRMIQPIGETLPYYVERFAATDKSWTAKMVFVAANAWDGTQAQWLGEILSEPTTYTFVVRHEPTMSGTAPGVGPSDQIIIKHPYTMIIAGHTHTYEHVPAYKTLIVGNGGAPLTSDADYGYVVIARQADGTIAVTSKDYMTKAVVDSFSVNADGSPATP
jgi:hypothetical protein